MPYTFYKSYNELRKNAYTIPYSLGVFLCYYSKLYNIKKWFITDFWNLIKEQQPQGGLTIDSRWL
jgi:hypothetical protein